MKKKLFAMLLTFILVLGLAACGGGGTEESANAPEQTKKEETKNPAKTDETVKTDSGKTDSGKTEAPKADPTEAPAAEATTAPEPTQAPAATMPDITGWSYYAGFIEQEGEFIGDTLLFTKNPQGTQAGMILVSAESIETCASIFGDFLYEDETGYYYIYESGTERKAVFQIHDIGFEGFYSMNLGGLGFVSIGTLQESGARDISGVATARTTDVTDAFLTEMAKILEETEDPQGSYYFSGTMDNGDSVYYARTMGGTNNWLVILSADRMQAVMAQGTTTYDAATQTECITDIFTGYGVFYQVQKVSGGYQLIFADGAMGTATLTKCSDYEVMDAMDYAFMEPQNITGEFVDKLNQH